MALVTRAAESKRPLELTGAWRLWPEHALGPRHQQGRADAPLQNINPDHAFEIHPITRIGRLGLHSTFHPVEGYKPGSPKTFTEVYEQAKLGLSVAPETVTLTVPTGLYNDVHFWLEPTGERHQVVRDGRFVTAAVLDEEGRHLVERLRMVLVQGTEPERIIRALRPGARRHVWGLPRVNLAELSDRIRLAVGGPTRLEGRLPYEIVVLGVYPEGQ